MPGLSERLALIIDATGIGAISEFRKVGTAAKKELGAADKAMSGTRTQGGLLGKGLDKLGFQSIDAGSALKAGIAGGATVAAVALVKFGKESVSAFSHATAEVSAFKRVAGGTAQDASRLVAAMKTLNVDVAAGGKAFGILSKNIENTPAKLAAVGVQIAKNKDGTNNLGATLLNVADAYQATNDQAEKNVIALTAFGKSGLALTPILARGREGLKELYEAAEKHHEIFSEEDLLKGKEFRLASKELSNALHGLQIEAGQKLVPELTKVALAFTSLVEKGDRAWNTISKLTGGHHKLSDSIINAIPGVGLLHTGIGLLGGKAKDAADASSDLAGAVNEAADAEAEATAKANDLAEATDKVASAMLSGVDDGLAYANSLLDLKDAQLALTEAEAARNQAVREHGANSAEAVRADQDWQHAVNSLHGSILDVAKAAAKQAEDQAKANGQAFTATDNAKAQIAALQGLEKQFPALTPIIENYIAELAKIPGAVNTVVSITGKGSVTTASGHNIHAFAEGGTVPGPVGAPQLAIVHGGEYVIPNGAKGGASPGGNTYVTINMPPGSDGDDVVAAIQRYERNNGKGWRSA